MTARKLISLASSSDDDIMPVDLLLFQPYYSNFARETRPLQLFPALIRQRSIEVVGSDTGEVGVDGIYPFKPSRAFRYRYKFRLYSQLALTGQAERIRIPFGNAS